MNIKMRFKKQPSVGLLISAVVVMLTQSAQAEITPNLTVHDLGPLQASGQQYVSYRLAVSLSGGDDWTSAVLSATVTDAEFYQDPSGDGNPPDPNDFGMYPDAEVTSYYTVPEDYPNVVYAGGGFGFNLDPNESATSLSADWFDLVDSGDGTYVIAQITVLPDTPFWTGQVDVTVYSATNPAGVTDTWTISSADYQPAQTATYVGPSSGTYNDPFNWDLEFVPINSGLDRFNVIIPASQTLEFDIAGMNEIDGIALGSDARLNFDAGEMLSVRGTSLLSGIIDASGAGSGFMAPSQFAAFGGTRSRVFISDGAQVHIAAPSYSFDVGDSRTSRDLLTSVGPGTLLDLSSLNTMSVPMDPYGSYSFYIAARDSAVIDLENVTTIQGAGTGCWGGCDYLRFQMQSGGDIDLQRLEQVSGYTWFEIDVPTYTLPLLQTASNVYLDARDAQTVNVPSMNSFSTGTLEVGATGTVNVPALESFTSSTMTIADGGIVNADTLTTVNSSVFDLNANRTLNAPPFVHMNHARIALSGGATMTTAAESYTFNIGDSRTSRNLLTVDGVGSLFDMSSVGSISVPMDPYGSYNFTFFARNQAEMNLENVTVVQGGGTGCWGGCDWLRFQVQSDGVLKFDRLETVTGNTWFDIDIPTYTLPALLSASNTYMDGRSATRVDLPVLQTFNGTFNLGVGTEMNAPSLETVTGSGNELIVPVFAKFNAPSLLSANDMTISLVEVGGGISAPNLTTYTHGTFSIKQAVQGGIFLDVPPFTDITNSRLFLEDGAVFEADATSYYFNWGDSRTSRTLMSADGSQTLLDLADLTSISVPMDPYGSYSFTFNASSQGTIDLSQTQSISGGGTGCWGGCDWLVFQASSGGTIHFGDVTVSGGQTRFNVSGSTTSFVFHGGLDIRRPSQFTASLGAVISLTGDYSFNHTSESDMSWDGGIVKLIGTDSQLLEVGGSDIGIPQGTLGSNFQFGQLVVGQTGVANTVRLVDNVDNGNREPSGYEALYLPGPTGGDDGLRILGGSTLVVENIQVYAQVQGAWVHINALIPDGANQVAFDQGFIALSVPETDCNENGIEDRVDILLGDSPDCNGNGIPDECEIDENSGAPGGPYYCQADCDPDCNLNGVPDACDIAEGTSEDCNGNGIPDSCDISSGFSADVNGNGIPDECEDCNENGTPDFQDIADLTSADCNNNGLPDECEIAAGSSAPGGPFFCTENCDPDCNNNGVPDSCDIANCIDDPACADCQPNGIPDGCDIASGNSTDLDGNNRPDECDTDCNENGIPDDQDLRDCDGSPWCSDCNRNNKLDVCDIADGLVQDGDLNGVPDECEQTPEVTTTTCRYINITPAAGTIPVALYVEGDSADGSVDCVTGYVQPDGRLGATPVFELPAIWSTVNLADQEIIAGANYTVYADFGDANAPLLSLPVEVSTLNWGDLSDDGQVNGYDLLSFVDSYRADLPHWIGDLCPEVPDGLVNGLDLMCWIDSYRSLPYPFWTCQAALRSEVGMGMQQPSAVLSMMARPMDAPNQDQVAVDVYLSGAENVRLFEVAIDAFGGESGSLVLEDVLIDPARADFIFANLSPVNISDIDQQRITSALWDGGVSTVGARKYLATFVYRPSVEARGLFELVLRSDPGTLLRDAASEPILVADQSGVLLSVGDAQCFGGACLLCADQDGDADVDRSDSEELLLAMAGPGIGSGGSDLDHDADVDMHDFRLIQACQGGADASSPCVCSQE
jgi:hypothetical protein